MKKIICIGVLLVMMFSLVSLTGCSNVELKEGVYVNTDEKEIHYYESIELYDNNKYIFERLAGNPLSGTYKIQKNKLILYTGDKESSVFDIKDDQLMYLGSKVDGLLVENNLSGTIFKYASWNIELKEGVYITDDKLGGVTLYDGNLFKFMTYTASDYSTFGRYYIKSGRLVLHAADNKQFIFDVDNDRLIYLGVYMPLFIAHGEQPPIIYKLSEEE